MRPGPSATERTFELPANAAAAGMADAWGIEGERDSMMWFELGRSDAAAA